MELSISALVRDIVDQFAPDPYDYQSKAFYRHPSEVSKKITGAEKVRLNYSGLDKRSHQQANLLRSVYVILGQRLYPKAPHRWQPDGSRFSMNYELSQLVLERLEEYETVIQQKSPQLLPLTKNNVNAHNNLLPVQKTQVIQDDQASTSSEDSKESNQAPPIVIQSAEDDKDLLTLFRIYDAVEDLSKEIAAEKVHIGRSRMQGRADKICRSVAVAMNKTTVQFAKNEMTVREYYKAYREAVIFEEFAAAAKAELTNFIDHENTDDATDKHGRRAKAREILDYTSSLEVSAELHSPQKLALLYGTLVKAADEITVSEGPIVLPSYRSRLAKKANSISKAIEREVIGYQTGSGSADLAEAIQANKDQYAAEKFAAQVSVLINSYKNIGFLKKPHSLVRVDTADTVRQYINDIVKHECDESRYAQPRGDQQQSFSKGAIKFGKIYEYLLAMQDELRQSDQDNNSYWRPGRFSRLYGSLTTLIDLIHTYAKQSPTIKAEIEKIDAKRAQEAKTVDEVRYISHATPTGLVK